MVLTKDKVVKEKWLIDWSVSVHEPVIGLAKDFIGLKVHSFIKVKDCLARADPVIGGGPQ